MQTRFGVTSAGTACHRGVQTAGHEGAPLAVCVLRSIAPNKRSIQFTADHKKKSLGKGPRLTCGITLLSGIGPPVTNSAQRLSNRVEINNWTKTDLDSTSIHIPTPPSCFPDSQLHNKFTSTYQLSSTFFKRIISSPFLNVNSFLVLPLKSNFARACPFRSGFSGDEDPDIT